MIERILLAVLLLLSLLLVLLTVACVLALPSTLRQMGYTDKDLTIWGR